MISERKKAYRKAWREAHKEEAKEYSKKWRKAHKKQDYEIKKKWRKSHPEIVKKSKQKWYETHKEHVLEQQKKRYKAHPENQKKKAKAWYQSHKEQAIKAALKRNQTEKGIERRKKYDQRIKLDVLTHYGNGIPKCVLCGHARLTSLSIDHINGGGCKHKKEVVKGKNFYCWLIKNNYPEGFRTLCLNCQFDEKIRLSEQKRPTR